MTPEELHGQLIIDALRDAHSKLDKVLELAHRHDERFNSYDDKLDEMDREIIRINACHNDCQKNIVKIISDKFLFKAAARVTAYVSGGIGILVGIMEVVKYFKN